MFNIEPSLGLKLVVNEVKVKHSSEKGSTNLGVKATKSGKSSVIASEQNKKSTTEVTIKKNNNSKNIPKKSVFPPFLRGLVWGSAFALTAAVSATIGATVTLVSPLSPIIKPLLAPFNHPESALSHKATTKDEGWGSLFQYHLSRPVNILFMGIDRVPDAPVGSKEAFNGRSDTILLVRFDPQDHSVRMLSIPRDSRVEIPGVGVRKINDANVDGGAELSAKVISQTLNDITIDRYVRVTTDTFRELVDLVGGIEVFVPYPMKYTDQTQKLDINLEEGWQTLDGQKAEQFARFRHDRYGDIGRVQRQQVLLKSLKQRLQSPAIIARIPQIIRVLGQYVDTNLSVEEMLALANFGKNLDQENFKMVMLPGRFSQQNEFELSYWIINSSGSDRVMQEYFAATPQATDTNSSMTTANEPNQIRIAIQNATTKPGIAREFADYLAENKFTNVYLVADSSQNLRETEIVVQKGDLEAAEILHRVLGVGRIESSSTGDIDSDVTIRIGDDWSR